jgi:hypothetical protein
MVATVRLQQPAPLGNSAALYTVEADDSWHRDIGLVGGSAHWLLGRGSAVAARVEHGTVLRRVRGELIESSQCSAWQQQLAWTPRGRRHLTSGSHRAVAAGSMAGGPHTRFFSETQINL